MGGCAEVRVVESTSLWLARFSVCVRFDGPFCIERIPGGSVLGGRVGRKRMARAAPNAVGNGRRTFRIDELLAELGKIAGRR